MDFAKIDAYVFKNYGVDLKAYKSKQLTRRIDSFMARVGAKNEDDFINILKNDITINKKFKDYLTINVSEFLEIKKCFWNLRKR